MMDAASVSSLIQRANELMAAGRHKEALLAYETALSIEPVSFDASLGKAASMLSLGEVAKAGRVLQGIPRALISDPRDMSRLSFWIADWQTKSGDAALALETLEAAIAAIPSRHAGRLHIQAAATMGLNNGVPEKIAMHLREAWGVRDQMSSQDLLWLGSVALMHQESDVAGDAVSAAIKSKPSIGAAYIWALAILGRLSIGWRLVLFVVLGATLLFAKWGWLAFLLIAAALGIGGLVGWRQRLIGLTMSSLGLSGLLLLAVGLYAIYLLLAQ